MGNTPIVTIDATGPHRPSLQDCLDYLVAGYQGIYGSDVYLGGDAQDGELLGLFASAYDDLNAGIVSAYNSFSPASAQGVGLSSNIKINGMARDVASYSTASVTLVGTAYTEIDNGLAADLNGNIWVLPATVVIPASGTISATATCQTIGAITAPANTITTIQTQTLGWQSVTNAAAASPGNPVERDAQVRVRQSSSTSAPSVSSLDSITGNLLAIPGVTAVKGYENDGDINDANGIPGRCISMVVLGGATQNIVNAIGVSKIPGGNTYGTSSGVYVDAYGIGHTIKYFVPTQTQLYFSIRLRALTGYTSDVGLQIQSAIAAYVNGLGIGQNLLFNRVNVPANLNGATASAAYEIISLKVARANSAASTNDVIAAFNEMFACAGSANVSIAVSLT